jgi:hypothetical protein
VSFASCEWPLTETVFTCQSVPRSSKQTSEYVRMCGFILQLWHTATFLLTPLSVISVYIHPVRLLGGGEVI